MNTLHRTALCALLLLAACSGTDRQLEDNARAYATAMANYRFDNARPFATDETADVTLRFYSQLMRSADTAYINANIPAEITIRSVDMTSDSTALVAYSKKSPGTKRDCTLRMKLVQGRWLADDVIDIPAMLNPGAHSHRKIPIEKIRAMQPDTTPLKRPVRP